MPLSVAIAAICAAFAGGMFVGLGWRYRKIDTLENELWYERWRSRMMKRRLESQIKEMT